MKKISEGIDFNNLTYHYIGKSLKIVQNILLDLKVH